MRLLLLSNSTNPGQPYLAWPLGHIRDFLGTGARIFFVPYAGVRMPHDAYTASVREALSSLDATIVGAHETADPAAELERADAIAVGGGNTFQLLARLYAEGLLDPIRKRVRAGVPYLGWSAGSNVACPTIRTTNDMPIIEPPSFAALGLVSFQINPHYTEARLPDHGGETRPERIAEYLELNRKERVVGLREGTGLRLDGKRLSLVGTAPLVLFRHGADPREAGPDDDPGAIILGP
ncbi:MAG TPA: dipeptidase PepE [Gemmatimonadales bacterium]|nr:dipeptidase PepE [Gemmatimonadales bacterium]